MKPDFTPAVWRVLAEAAHWTSCTEDAPLALPEVLRGLLSEGECRAATLLASHGIDFEAIHRRWPKLRRVATPSSDRAADFSPELIAAFAEARHRLVDLPQPLSLATEHILLGILATSSEVAAWLTQHALIAHDVEIRIFRWEGVTPGPLEMNAECEERTAESGSAIHSPTASGNVELESSRSSTLRLPPDQRLLRVLDASANRAREGLRVIEDYVRYVLDDRHLTGQLKHLRHRLSTRLAALSTESLLASRETQADVGTQLSTETERTRLDLVHVVTANFKRLEESLRSLEEYSKTVDPALAVDLEQIRYQVYTLERAVNITANSLDRLAGAMLYVLIDGRESTTAFEELAVSLISAGVHVLQLREKRLSDRDLVTRARLLREWTRGSRTLFIMNDRPDLAALCQADGVHVGQDELSVKDARALVGSQAFIGVSTHSVEQARQAVLDGADYIGVGPTFLSGTKHFESFTGPELLRAVAHEIRLPAFAIGGITLENIAQVLSSGITRIAVSGAVCSAARPADVAREFLGRLARDSYTDLRS